MIQICKDRIGEFYVVNVGAEHKVLSCSNPHKSKKDAYDNIHEQRFSFTQDSPGSVLVQDNTGNKPKVVLFRMNKECFETKYMPQSVYDVNGRGFIVNIPEYAK
jgi:hypothetical protein